MVFSNNLLMGAAAAASGGGLDPVWVPKGSIWFDRGNSYLTRTPSSAGNRKTFSLSCWIKMATLSADQTLWNAAPSGTGNEDMFIIRSSNIPEWMGAGYTYSQATRVLRDPTAWYHILFVRDSTNTVVSQRALMWINGELITNTAGNTITLDSDATYWNNTNLHSIGNRQHSAAGPSSRYGGYLSEAINLDGYAATPSDFGKYDSNGVWVPVEPTDLVTAQKGTNGFWLDFADSSDLGNDVSGNNNDWALTGLSSTNVSADRCSDEAPNTGNFATFNSSYREGSGYNVPLSNGNLTYANSGFGRVSSAIGTIGVSSGKFYWEVTWSAASPYLSSRVGIAQVDDRAANPDGGVSQYLGRTAGSFSFAAWASGAEAGKKETSASFSSYYDTAVALSDTVGVAFDADNGAIWISVNGSWVDGSVTGQSSATVLASIETYANNYVMFDGLTDGPYVPVCTWDGSNGTGAINFGQTAFDYTPPTGFKKLNSSNMSEPDVKNAEDNFLPIVYEGNGAGQRVGNFIPFTDSYTVGNSARFDGAEDYLRFNPTASAAGQKTFTISAWMKKNDSADYQSIISATDGATATSQFGFGSSGGGGTDNLLWFYTGGSNVGVTTTIQVSGISSWNHILLIVDTTESTNTNRIKIYLNGVQQTLTTFNSNGDGGYPTLNEATKFCLSSTFPHRIGSYNGTGAFLNAYVSEFVFIDGTAYGPSSFGQTDTSTNRWIPKDVSGLTFGTNGCYLPFPQKNAYGLDTSQGASAALDAQTLFLANFDGSDAATSATDSSNFSHTITFAGNAQLDTAIKKFGTAALLLDGSGDYVSMASFPPLADSSFCIEGFAYLTDGSGTQLAFIGNRDGGADDDSWLINIGGTAKRMSVRTDNTEVMASDTDITLNTWTHIAYTWDGTTNRLFQAGALVASSTAFTPNYSDINTLYIGHDGRGTTNDWPGSIDEVRVVKGSAVYTSTFTPPTSAYSAPAAGNMFVPYNLDQIYGSNQMYDTPTKNFDTFNPYGPMSAAGGLTEGNLKATGTPDNTGVNVIPANGKFYWEVLLEATAGTAKDAVGVMTVDRANTGSYGLGSFLYAKSGETYGGSAWTSGKGWASYLAGDVIGIYYNAGSLTFYKNGASQGTVNFFNGSSDVVLTVQGENASTVFVLNTGQWIYFDGATTTLDANAGGYFQQTSLPTDSKALQQDNYDASTAGITGFSWIKNRDAADNHVLQNRVSGVGKYLESNSAIVETTNTNSVQRFLQQGVQIGNMDAVNTDGESYVLWQWAANGTGTTNSDGSGADVTVSANATAGFSIVKYVGDDTSGRTIGTGLTAQPAFILVKNIDNGTYNWIVYHKSVGNTGALSINDSDVISTSSTYWNNTSPATSSPFVFSVGNSVATNKASDDFIAYVFAEIEGYSQFGEYTGNGNADGPVVNLGFKPAFVLIKATQRSNNWHIFDSARNPYNQITNDALFPDLDLAEGGTNAIDFLSNSFKLRTSEDWLNSSSSNNYIYAAFASNPFGGSGVNQGKAR